MNTCRRSFLLAGASALAAPYVARAQEELILRRPLRPGEDERWHALTQQGPYNPQPTPAIMPLGTGRVAVHSPRVRKSGRLVVFSHGALTDPQVYRPLLQHLASHGFVVLAPIHDDSVFERGLLVRRASAVGSSTWEVDRVLNDAVAWDARAEACRVCVEHADLVGKAIGMEVVTDRAIIMGHEFGAYVAQVLVGASVVDPNGRALDFSDERWFAALMLSPQGSGIMGLTDTSWDKVARPLMAVQGGRETDFTGQAPERKIDCYRRSPQGNKHLAWFGDGTRNLYLGPRAGARVSDVTDFEDLKAVATAFCLSYAEYDQDTFARISGDWAERSTLSRVVTRYR